MLLLGAAVRARLPRLLRASFALIGSTTESKTWRCSSSINVTAQLDGPGSFTVTSIELRTPSLGYTSPLGCAHRSPSSFWCAAHAAFPSACSQPVTAVRRQAILFTSFGAPAGRGCRVRMGQSKTFKPLPACVRAPRTATQAAQCVAPSTEHRAPCSTLFPCVVSKPRPVRAGKPDVAATKRFDEVFSEHEFHALVSELHAQVCGARAGWLAQAPRLAAAVRDAGSLPPQSWRGRRLVCRVLKAVVQGVRRRQQLWMLRSHRSRSGACSRRRRRRRAWRCRRPRPSSAPRRTASPRAWMCQGAAASKRPRAAVQRLLKCC